MMKKSQHPLLSSPLSSPCQYLPSVFTHAITPSPSLPHILAKRLGNYNDIPPPFHSPPSDGCQRRCNDIIATTNSSDGTTAIRGVHLLVLEAMDYRNDNNDDASHPLHLCVSTLVTHELGW